MLPFSPEERDEALVPPGLTCRISELEGCDIVELAQSIN